MADYKFLFENKLDGVEKLSNGLKIYGDQSLGWGDFIVYLLNGGQVDPWATPAEIIAIEAEATRLQAIVDAQTNAGLQTVTIEQAYAYIDNQIDSATNTAETIAAIKTVLKKIIPYIL